LSFLDNYSGYH
jgi:hypothetical protein